MSDSNQRVAGVRFAKLRPRWLPSFGRGGPRLWLATLLGSAGTRLGAVFEREMDEGRGFLWLPVLFGFGILLYFALPREPSAVALAAMAIAFAGATVFTRHRTNAFRTMVALAAIASGTAAIKFRTDWVAAPMLTHETTAAVTGWIAAREEAARGGMRLLLRVHELAGLSPEATPAFVRFTVRSQAEGFAVGDAITAQVRLQPPSGPVMPGGYDFARAAFYDRIGAIGFAYGAAKPAEVGPPPFAVTMKEPLAALRNTMRVRIEEALPGDHGHIAAALVMGDQRGISEKTQEAMRASGLGHIFSISGLHMALVAGSAFWLIRALLALSPSLALRRPIKKWAALGALGVATFYLGISGAEVATVRSYVMLAIMLLAVVIDRRALTLRNVVLAALVILVVNPESLLSISFQMSFAATVALVATYEAIAARADRLALTRSDLTVSARIRQAILTLFLTSLVAGLATTPFGAYYFQRVAPLTIIANMAVAPAVGLVIMPMALASVVLMPFGLEALPLRVMSYGLDWMIAVAEKTTAWSEGLGGVPKAPVAALLITVAGFLWLALWRERWRLAGLVPIVLAVPLAVMTPRPDIIVAQSGAAVAVRAADGHYRILGGKDSRFEIENWLSAEGDARSPKSEVLRQDVGCDALGCIAKLGDGGKVALIFRPDAFREDCQIAAVVVTRLNAPHRCAEGALVIDRTMLERTGAQALYVESGPAGAEGGFRIETAYPSIRRPFMPPVHAAVASQ
jgi:competence protein ComEC